MGRIGAHKGQLLRYRQIADFVEENLEIFDYFKFSNIFQTSSAVNSKSINDVISSACATSDSNGSNEVGYDDPAVGKMDGNEPAKMHSSMPRFFAQLTMVARDELR